MSHVFTQNAIPKPEANLTWIEQATLILNWVLLISVALLSAANLLVYLFVPVDGASLWVRQGPIQIERIAKAHPDGVQPGDVVLAVEGRAVEAWLAERWQTWPAILGRWREVSPEVEITVERDGIPQTFTSPLFRRAGGKLRSQFLVRMLLTVAYLFVSLLILKTRCWESEARLATLVLTLLALIEQSDILPTLGAEWGLSTLWLFIPLRLLTRWFAYGAALHFCMVFPVRRNWIKKRPWLPALVYLLNPLVSLLLMASVRGNLQIQHGVAYPWSKNIYIVYLAFACGLLIYAYFAARTSLEQVQMRWIAWGASLAIIPNVILNDLPLLLGGQRQLSIEVSGLLMFMLPLTIAIVILRYRLWDVNLVIRASLLYGTLSLLLGMIYLALISVFIGLVGSLGFSGQLANNPLVYFLTALFMVSLVNPTKDRLQRLIDRLFYRDKLNYTEILSELSRAFSTSILSDDVTTLLLEVIPERLKLTGAEMLVGAVPSPDTSEYHIFMEGKAIWLFRLHGEPIPRPFPLNDLQMSNMWVCTPLLAGETLLGVYGLGLKKSGEFFNIREIELLETLSRQAGIALQNALLHAKVAEQVRLERDLEIARRVQLSLLPAVDPVHHKLDIVGYSSPAQSVGGDFYHYVDFDEKRLGIVVGDASGKGVSAALLMAVSLSTLRAQAPAHPHQTAALLTEMNTILKSQTRLNDVNVAMLYALIEDDSEDDSSGDLRIKVSNGGLVSPILYRPGQSAEFLDACGLPLGIIDAPSYYECSLQLQPGDLIILCSDGIVEAKNENQEMFGFERLLAIIDRASEKHSAEQVMGQLQQAVTSFVNGTPQHDDITVVAIRARQIRT